MNAMNSNSEIEEERRLCYVAITRAREKLYITNSVSRMLYGQRQINPVSRFVKEIDEDLLNIVNEDEDAYIHKTEVPKKVLIEETNDLDLKPNDYVYHDVFGTGKVITVEKTIVKVAFKMPYGIKILMKNHPSLHKVE